MGEKFKILTIVGARPQFVKAAMISMEILHAHSEQLQEFILHTGQHFDKNMSDIFFRDMAIPKPSYQLNINNCSHGQMTGAMLSEIEKIMLELNPDMTLVYGDTNSTVAGALAAAKLQIPVAHVESGLRSFNKRMPEELNRIMTDHISSLLFCPTTMAVTNLRNENIRSGVYQSGDVMYDAALIFGKIADSRSKIIENLRLEKREYYLATVHRAENTDDKKCLANILGALAVIADRHPVIIPLHPRTRHKINDFGLVEALAALTVIDPVSFIDMIALEKHARTIITDSGGVQKEAYFHGVPCVTVREETEWVETIDAGWNVLAGNSKGKIISAVIAAKRGQRIEEYGTGRSAQNIVFHLAEFLRRNTSVNTGN